MGCRIGGVSVRGVCLKLTLLIVIARDFSVYRNAIPAILFVAGQIRISPIVYFRFLLPLALIACSSRIFWKWKWNYGSKYKMEEGDGWYHEWIGCYQSASESKCIYAILATWRVNKNNKRLLLFNFKHYISWSVKIDKIELKFLKQLPMFGTGQNKFVY